MLRRPVAPPLPGARIRAGPERPGERPELPGADGRGQAREYSQ